jgi:hypothetical protein
MRTAYGSGTGDARHVICATEGCDEWALTVSPRDLGAWCPACDAARTAAAREQMAAFVASVLSGEAAGRAAEAA